MATPITTMSRVRVRAEELLSLGLTKHRAFRVLKREFRDVERDMLHKAIPLRGAPRGVNPTWTEHGQCLRPVVIRTWGKKKLGRPDAL